MQEFVREQGGAGSCAFGKTAKSGITFNKTGGKHDRRGRRAANRALFARIEERQRRAVGRLNAERWSKV